MAFQESPASGGASFSYASALRLGPALPPNGTPTPRPSLERLNERLERLAFGERLEGSDPPPLETYTVATAEHGDVYRATDEYVRWFRRTYSAAGGEDRVSGPPPRSAPEGMGGEAPVVKRKQGHFFE